MRWKIALFVVAGLLGVFVIWPHMRGAWIKHLVGELSKADPTRREAIVDELALEEAAPVRPLVAALPGQDKAVTLAILRTLDGNLAWCSGRSTVMNCTTGYVPGRADSIEALDDAVPVLVSLLQSPDADIRLASLRALETPNPWALQRRNGFSEFESALKTLIRDSDSRVRLATVPLVHQLRIEATLETLVRDPDRDVRLAVVQVAKQLEPEKASPLLLAVIADKDDALRQEGVDYAIAYLNKEENPWIPHEVSRRLNSEIVHRIEAVAKSQSSGSGIFDIRDLETLMRALQRKDALAEIENLIRSSGSIHVKFAAAESLLLEVTGVGTAVDALLEIARGDNPYKLHAEQLVLQEPTWSHWATQDSLKRLKIHHPDSWQRLQESKQRQQEKR